jgi:hypothetical protein
MKKVVTIGSWLKFLIVGIIGTWLALGITCIMPLFAGLWMFNLSDFWFYTIGSVLLTLYYILIIVGLSLFFSYVNKLKQDYWVSNILLVLTSVYFFFNLITKLGVFVNKDIEIFMNFKGIVLLISILPAYFKILYLSVIIPFLKQENQ